MFSSKIFLIGLHNICYLAILENSEHRTFNHVAMVGHPVTERTFHTR